MLSVKFGTFINHLPCKLVSVVSVYEFECMWVLRVFRFIVVVVTVTNLTVKGLWQPMFEGGSDSYVLE